jgi:hypothetical protein
MDTLLTGMYPFDYTGRAPVDVIHDRLPRLMEREGLEKLATAGREVVRLIQQVNPVHRITESGALKLDWSMDMVTGQQVTEPAEGVGERMHWEAGACLAPGRRRSCWRPVGYFLINGAVDIRSKAPRQND